MDLRPGDFQKGIRAYWKEINRRSTEVQERERGFSRLAVVYANRGPPHFRRAELETIMWWKHTDGRWRDRALKGIALIDEARISEATSRIETSESATAAYGALTGLAQGIGVASISAILAAARPDRFAVIDVFALMALLEHIPEPWHVKVRFDRKGKPVAHERLYPAFAETCCRVAQFLREETGLADWTPRRVDMALWGIGKALDAAGWSCIR